MQSSCLAYEEERRRVEGKGMQSSGKSKKKEEDLRKQGCRAVA